VLASVMGIIIFKPILIGGVLLLAGQRPTVAVQVGLALAQVGEFAFVLMRFGSGFHLIPEAAGQVFLSASVITMIVTPLMLAASPPLLIVVRRWEEKGWWRPAKDLRLPAQPAAPLQDHVVIVGYGFNGRNLARVLKEIEIPYVVLEMNPLTVRQARAEGENIVYGDASSHGILEKLGAAEARVLVLAISDPVLTRRAAAVARRSFPGLHVVVRTRYLSEVDELYRLGADAVIPEEVETSVEVFSRVLEQFGVPRETLVKHARRIRAERYGLFRGGRPASVPEVPAEEAGLSGLKQHIPSFQVMLCTIPAGCPAAGRSLRDLDLHTTTGAKVLAVLRDREVLSAPSLDARLHAGDSVVLLGNPEQVGAAAEALIGPGG
jgi:CPA2 family monovalent cation:H+ antiporter-2